SIKAGGDSEVIARLEEEFTKESVTLKSTEAAMKSFCSATNRKTDSVRTRVVATLDSNGRIVSFDRSAAQRAVQASKKASK
ncbi:MAG: hypothetical protein LUC83_11080, partial [Clostridiales bacterium]|nr:hypothetical protein [Clostridiales bacterium]